MRIRYQYMIIRRLEWEDWTTKGKKLVPVPPRHRRVMDAAAEFGILGRWILIDDLERLLRTRPATSRTCWEIFEKEKGFYDSKFDVIRKVAQETGILVKPTQELLVFSAPTKSIVLEVMSKIKYSFGSLGATVANYPVQGLGFRYAIVDVHDGAQWQKFEKYGMIGNNYWSTSCYRDDSPLIGVVPTEEVDLKLGHIRTIVPPQAPKKEKYGRSDRWTVFLPPGTSVTQGGQLGDLKKILQCLHGRTLDWYYIEREVTYAAGQGKLTTSQPPDRIIGYYRSQLIREGVLRRA